MDRCLQTQTHKKALLILPVLLVPSMAMVFTVAGNGLGTSLGYLLGFVIYWVLWCWMIPWVILGTSEFASLIKDREPLFTRSNWLAASLWLFITVVAFLMYGQSFLQARLVLILMAIPIAIANGLSEELFWRGLFVRAFPKNFWLGCIYPAVGFALWHFVPQILLPAENRVGFVISTLFLGLANGWIAFRTGSAKWTAISHSLNGVIALAAPLAQIIISLMI